MHVTAWTATLSVGEAPAATSMELSVDATSLRVHKGTGGVQALGDEERSAIHQTIDEEVLKREDIEFRSTSVEGDAGRMSVEGELTILGTTRPIAFELVIDDDGALSAAAVVTQTAWRMKPYSALFGALKVADDVEVVLDGHL
jgi:polyisoprenoid-binding protein YceI